MGLPDSRARTAGDKKVQSAFRFQVLQIMVVPGKKNVGSVFEDREKLFHQPGAVLMDTC